MSTRILLQTVALSICCFTLFGFFPEALTVIYAQSMVEGTVIEAETGSPLPGVNVYVEGSQEVVGAAVGTQTGPDGTYSVRVPEGLNTLVFSYIGYHRVEVTVDERTRIDVTMRPDVRALDDVVVVAYGRQEKINLTGAVDQVSGEMLESRPMANVTQGLQGLIPNVNINMIEGKPIHAPQINIRGATSIGQGGSALVLIDGVEGDPSMLNPNDIESVSVLKDASSAAAYGARGAFGVVLITTKRPTRNAMSISYSGGVGVNQPTVDQNQYVTDGLQWAKMFVESFTAWEGTFPQNSNKTLPFSEEYLAELERRSQNPNLPKTEIADDGSYRYYHSTDWFSHLFKSNALAMDHNLAVSGGAEDMAFRLSGRLKSQDGLIRLSPDDFRTMNLRAVGEIQLTDRLQVSNNFDISNRTYFNPQNCCDAQFAQLDIALEGFPLAPLYNPDGTLTHSGAYALGGYALGHNGIDLEKTIVRNTAGFEAQIVDNVRLIGDFTFNSTIAEEEQKRVPVEFSRTAGVIENIGANTNWLRITNDKINYVATNVYGQYQNVLRDKHDLQATLGTNIEQSTFRRLRTQRNGLIFPDARDINLALGEDIHTSGGYERWGIFGGFGRLNYIYNNRYLLELTGRYDGSSKFPEDEQYGFFPSASAGWRVSEESFWNLDLISHLQLRASYGSMGNGNIGAYAFHETFGVSQSGRIIDGVRPQRTSSPSVHPDGLTWETATTKNLGVDLGMFDGRLEFTGDAYVRETTDMFSIALTPPAIFGASPPRGNYADMRTSGWEMMLTWRHDVPLAGKPMDYNIRLTLSDHQAEITRYNNPDGFLNDYYEGMRVGEIWGYETEGFFESEADIAAHADQSLFRSTSSRKYFPGDIKFRDLNGDGVINPGENTVSNPGDRRIIGNSTPRYQFGIQLGGEWNNIFVSTIVQGVGKRDWYPSREANFWGQYNRPYNHIPAWHLNEGIIWSEENPDSFFPRYVSRIASTGNGTLSQTQTQYRMNAAYVRLKNLQVGYKLPYRLASAAGMKGARIFFSGENLWAWSPLYKTVDNLDVENTLSPVDQMARPGDSRRQGYSYPIQRSLTLGLAATL